MSKKQNERKQLIDNLIIAIHFGQAIDNDYFKINKKKPRITQRSDGQEVFINTESKNILDEYDEQTIYKNVLNLNFMKNINEYMILFYLRRGFKKSIDNDLIKIMNNNNKTLYDLHILSPSFFRYDSCLYIDNSDIIELKNSNHGLQHKAYYEATKAENNITKYCNPIIKNEYNKLLETYLYKDINNIITNYLLI